MQLKRVILHPKSRQIGDVIDDGIIHAKQRAQHNIAMLKLDRQVHFTEFVKPIALANSPSLINCSFTGWEKEKEGWEYKEYLNSLNPKENEDYLDSLFDQLIHKKNITPQIKVGKPEIPIKEHEFNKRKMLTVDMSNVSSWNNILEITTPKKKHFTKGDYGAPLICNIAGQPYARGVSAVGFKLTELFTDIFVNMAWILEMYKTIDNERPFHTELDIYSGVKLTSRFVIRKHLEYTLKGAVGYVPFEFNRKYEDQKLEGSNFTEMWRNMLVENFVRIHHNKFCMYKIIGYKEMDNVYDCATWCLLQNGNRICNYLPSLSRCYLAHHGFVPRYCADMPAQQSVVIYIDTSVVDHFFGKLIFPLDPPCEITTPTL
uniref:Peptidase S1 domain-containing protein n=1 Tax=Romanomermis culicivorax TaxID=13658 RepID=A0A915J910_ROMCU